MASKGPLRAVKATDKPTKPAARSLRTAADGSERELLVTMRAKLTAVIDEGVPPHALAPLYRQLREIDKDIRVLDARESGTAFDANDVDGDVDWDASTI